MIRYSLLRVLIFFGCLGLLWLVGLRSPNQAALLFLGAALLSLPVSYVVLRPFREDYSRQIAERVEARRLAKEGRVSDEDIEDAEIAGEPLPGRSARGAGVPPEAAGRSGRAPRPGPVVEPEGPGDPRDDFR